MFVDANVVLRILFGDPPELAEQAFQALVRLREEDCELVLAPVTLAEVVWTLERGVKVARVDIATELVDFLSSFGIAVPDRAWIEALAIYGEHNVPYGDAVLAAVMRQAQEEELLSFDEHFDSIPGIRRLDPAALAGGPGGAGLKKPGGAETGPAEAPQG